MKLFGGRNRLNNARGFTLIELLIVIAIIGILASVVLVRLVGAREKAQWASYIAYVSQVTKMVKAASALGVFDSIGDASGIPNGCLGLYSGDSCWGGSYSKNDTINSALSNAGTIPKGVSCPGNASNFGTIIRAYPTFVRVFVGMGSPSNVAEGMINMDKYCGKFGWNDWDNTKRNDIYILLYRYS